MLIAMLCVMVAACSRPNREIVGVEREGTRVDALQALRQHDIFIATTRQRAPDRAILYSGKRSRNVDFAQVGVTIPPVHRVGRIERVRRGAPDPLQHFTVPFANYLPNEAAFVDGVTRALQARAPEHRDVLMFVHGYNTDISAAILRLAQIVEDTGFKGVPVLFSWPSGARLTDYGYDVNSALFSRDGLARVWQLLAQTPANNFDLISHSMGNFVVVETMRQVSLQDTGGDRHRVRHMVFASPDIDIDLFEAQMRKVRLQNRKIFILISRDDGALALSSKLAGNVSRVGNADPNRLAALGVTVIDLTKVDDRTTIHHAKFADSPEIVRLLGMAISQDGAGTAQSNPQAGSVVSTVVSGVGAVISTVAGGGRVVTLDN